MALVQPLHGPTFALLHLACMDMIGRVVPAASAVTAQAVYGNVALGATSATVTLASGPMYDRLGPAAFWVMAALCAAALPLARASGCRSSRRLRSTARVATAARRSAGITLQSQ